MIDALSKLKKASINNPAMQQCYIHALEREVVRMFNILDGMAAAQAGCPEPKPIRKI